MSTANRLLTAEEFWLRPDEPGVFYELESGELHAMSPAGGQHGSVNMRLGGHLAVYVLIHGLGEVFSPDTGFVVARDPDTVLCPDIAFLSRARLGPEGVTPRFIEGPPDLAMESMSPSDSHRAAAARANRWLGYGVKLLWVADPTRRTLTVYRKGSGPRTLAEDDFLDGEDIVPGFRLRVGDIFPG
jgi:Uma2 family endonuclease